MILPPSHHGWCQSNSTGMIKPLCWRLVGREAGKLDRGSLSLGLLYIHISKHFAMNDSLLILSMYISDFARSF